MKEKIKTWAELIESEKLEEVLEDIQMNIRVQLDSKLNKYIFKLLLYLSHTADKCNKQNYVTGKRIAELTKLLCSLLIEVPDDKTYVISLYHIIRCLISLNLYEDAANICCYLQLGNLYNSENSNVTELLIKILFLWRTPINNIYQTFTTETLSTESYNNLKSIIKHEMKMVQIAYKNYTKPLIVRISSHLDKMDKIATINKEIFDDFCKYILEYLMEAQLCLDKDDKYVIYSHILHIIYRLIYKNINMTHIKCVVKTLNKLTNYFKNLLAEDEECYQCFQQFQSLCTILLIPVENFVNDNAEDIRNFVHCNLKIAHKYGYIGCLKWNAFTIAEIVEPLFIYWEMCITTHKQQFFDTDILLETINLIVHISIYFSKDISNKCKSCLNEECTVKKNIHNAVVLICRCVNLVGKFPLKTLPKKVCTLTRKVLEQNVAFIHEMRECKCKRWTHLWTTCGTLIYNMGILSDHIYEESVHLFSLLCTCIFRFQGIESNSKCIALDISSILYRLSATYYTNGMYREAMTASALNALLTYNRSSTKAFHIWVNIKKKCASEKIANLSMLECLRNDKDKISEIGLTIDFFKYDLIQLCLREARSLLEEKIAFANGVRAVLEEFRKLKPNNCQYAHIIQLLGHYFLSLEHDSSILEYHKQAISNLKQDKSNSIAIMCLEANLTFFMFVEELYTMNKQTHIEMENTKFALYAPKLPELRETKSANVVPAYTMLNIKKDSSLKLSLQKTLKKWKQLFKYNVNEIIKNWEPNLILSIVVTAGEYSRLYRYEDCEVEAWTLAYRLASKINDYRTIIYVTGRSISLRQVNYDWIDVASKYAMKYKDSEDGNVICAIAIFWISLADFYFECGKYEDAKQLLTDARNLPKISFISNTSVYLLSLDTIIRNCNLYKDNVQQENYILYIVQTLYAMVNLSEDLSTGKNKNQVEYLFSYDVLFNTTVNLSMRANSLLSFREISAHLVRRVKMAQSLGAVMRTAELLKSLCYIDLSRSKLDDCEVKLQGLEHMLDIETFELSMHSKPTEMPINLAVTPIRIVDPVRDVPQRDASPVLGMKVFDLPKFTLHTNCDCYMCGNISYQYLVFIATYIRAQLYALQNHVAIALDHFHGVFKIRQRLFDEKESVLPENQPRNETGVKRFCWQARSYITDYVQLLIDFCYFLKTNVTSRQQDAFDIANLAINICHKYKLEGHPVYLSAKELAIDNDSQAILESLSTLDFTVPQPHDIDISDYMEVPINQNICVTPSIRDRQIKKPFSVRRKRNPMVLNLDKIDMILSDDEDNNGDTPNKAFCSSNMLTPSLIHLTKKPKSHAKSVRRKIVENDLSDCASTNTEDSTSIEKLKNHGTRKKNNVQFQKKSKKDVKVIPLGPDVTQNLKDTAKKSDVSAMMENADKLIEKVEHMKVSTLKKKEDKNAEQVNIADCNKNVNQAVELLKNMAINEKTNDNIDSSILMEKANTLQNQETLEMDDEKKSIKNTRILKKRTESVTTTSANEVRTIRTRNAKLFPNNEVHSMKTTKSTRK